MIIRETDKDEQDVEEDDEKEEADTTINYYQALKLL